LGDGYEEVSHPHHALIDEPEPPRIALQYRGADGVVTPIWPSLYGVNDVVKGGLALFVGEKAYVQPDRVTHPRLFAVRSPALPLDITDEVLRRWAQANGRDVNQARQKITLISPEEADGGVAVHLEFWTGDPWVSGQPTWPEQSSLRLDWRQVEDIMRTVKAKGSEQTDLRWHTAYIGERP
jgi:hypothetical protein